MDNKLPVLIVEDDKVLCTALVDKFSASGFNVSSASNGDEGLKKALNDHPYLIVLDLTMPKKDGWQVLEELRKDSWGVGIPVIILTNSPVDDVNQGVDKIVKFQPSYYFLKTDIDLDFLIIKVKELLKLE